MHIGMGAGLQPQDLQTQGLQAVGAIRRQVRGERRLHHQRLRHAFASRVVGQLAGEIRR